MTSNQYYSINPSRMDPIFSGRGSKYGAYPRDFGVYPRGSRSDMDDREYENSQLSGSYDPRYKMSKPEDSDLGSREGRTLRTILDEFADMTSLQGINYVHLSRKLWLRGIWLFIFLGSCGAMIFHLYYLSSVFFSFAKQSKIELGFDSLTFPAITMCNINPIRSSMLHESGTMMETLMHNTNTTNQINHLTRSGGAWGENSTGPGSVPTNTPATPTNRAPSDTPTDSYSSQTGTSTEKPTEPPPKPSNSASKRRRKRYLDDLSVNYTNSYSNYTDDLEERNDPWAKEAPRTTESRVEEEFQALFSSMTRNKRIRVGHQLKDFMVQSSFAGRTVNTNNFKTYQSMTYGNCFTLQYPDFISRKGGPVDGLEVILFLENDEYLRGWTNGNGAHLVIHNLDTIPLIDQDGIAVAGGSETFIGIKRINIHRLGSPYGYCDDGTDFKTKFNLTYTRQACQDYCQVRLFVEKCNCMDGRNDELNRLFKLTDSYRECRSPSEIKCLVEVQKNYEFGKYSSLCTCHSPCNETKFEKSISSRQWPSVEYGQVLVEAICAKTSDQHCKKLREYNGFQLSHNFIKLNIYYEDLNYENITEDADYAEVQFVSDIGGTLGLWIGMSAISIFEVIQFVLEVIAICCKCKNGEKDRKSETRMRTDQIAPERMTYQKPDFVSTDFGNYQLNRRH